MKIRISLLFIALAVFAIPTFAQSNYEQLRQIEYEDGGGGGGWSDSVSHQNGGYFDNPCTATVDWAWYAYDVAVYQEGKEALSNLDLLFDEQTSISGSYSVAGSSQSDVNYKQQPLEIRKYRPANWYDKFHLVTVIRFDPATRTTSVTMETACGNGMPDSVE